MKKLAKIQNTQTKEVIIAVNEQPDEEYFIKHGFSWQDVEETMDGRWFLSGFAPAPDYVEQRRAAYPSVADQLDMLYWDAVRGKHLWQEAIAAVKARYPKPSEQVNDQVSVQETED